MKTTNSLSYQVLSVIAILFLIVLVILSIEFLIPNTSSNNIFSLTKIVVTPIVIKDTQVAVLKITFEALGIPHSRRGTEIARLEGILQRKGIDQDTFHILSTNLAVEKRFATREAEAMLNYIPGPRNSFGPPDIRLSTETPTDYPRTGIFFSGPPPFVDIKYENYWSGWILGEYVNIYAGAYYNDPEQGVIVINPINSDKMVGSRHPTPIKAGTLIIIKEENQRLVIRSKNGLTFYFDAPSLTFVSSISAHAPTITPIFSIIATPTAISPYP